MALLLGLLLTSLAWRALAQVRRATEALALRGEALDAVRTARHVLSRELRGGGSLVLAADPAADTLAVRALRGVALVCPGSVVGDGMVVVPDGARAPDPAKDSVWVLVPGQAARPVALVSSEPAPPCAALGPEGASRWTVSEELPPAPELAVYFEHGSYHLSGAALRYRRGDAGRQPLTPEVLLAPPSRFEPWRGSAAVRLVADGHPSLARRVVPWAGPEGGGG